MSAPEKLLGACAAIMALCCALWPVAGAAVAGGLVAGAGVIGVIVGAIVLVAVGYGITRRRRSGPRC
jgi:hypothetical protein